MTHHQDQHQEVATDYIRPKIEIVRVPSTERGSFRPLDGVQLRAAYSHVRVGTYCPEPIEPPEQIVVAKKSELKPPVVEQSRKYKKNLGPVSRLLRRRHHATSLATKSCDNIYSVNKSNSFFEWKHGHSGHDQGRQSNSLDWRVGRSIDRNSSNLEYRKASLSAEHLSRSGALQTPSTKSKFVSLLKRLSPRLPRPNSKNSLPSSPSICPWVQVEYSNNTDAIEGRDEQSQQQESDYSFQRELQLNEMRKKAIKSTRKEVTSDVVTVRREKKSPQSHVQIQEKQDSNPNLRAVHEDRGTSEERRSGVVVGVGNNNINNANNNNNNSTSNNNVVAGSGSGRREVAGLLARSDSPDTSLPRTSRRSRPHSLAVQPLNYQRLDPEQQFRAAPPRVNVVTVSTSSKKKTITTTTTVTGETGKHSSMTSQESIGSCSLDVERSASDRSDQNAGSLSEKTLHSLTLSTCNGDSNVEPAIRVSQHYSESLSNGHEANVTTATENNSNNIATGTIDESDEQLTRFSAGTKKPSYLGLACSISGYSGITRYDSKLREGFRSRDSSPGARLIVRDTSPAGFRSSDSQSLTPQPNQPKSQSISPLAMERQRNGLSNGVRDKFNKYQDSRTTSPNSSEGYSEVDRGIVAGRDESILSPIRASSPNCKSGSPVAARIASYNQQNRSNLSASSPKSLNISNSSHNESGILNGSSLEQDASICILNASSGSEKSFIQQRVERLYGPGALAQGFYKRSSVPRSKLNASSDAPTIFNKSINNDTSVDEDAANAFDDEESLKSLPVLRHLRPEFRAQLPVVSPRRPTDGTEQVIKPLKRISLIPTKTDTKETKESPRKQKIEKTTDNTNMAPAISNNADQKPAAPEVVLPAMEPSVKLIQPGQTDDQEKDGHYYLHLLNTEKSRLLALSQQAQEELANCTELGIPEEVAGKLRSAIGKTGLLTEQRMKQFEGLCQKNLNKVPNEEFPTTNQDLAGFWDMVMLQVDNIDEMYDTIKTLRKSGWKEAPDGQTPVPEHRSVPSTPQNGTATRRRQTPASKTKSAADVEAARKARESREQSRRQMLEERRRAMRANANKSTDNAIEIFVPES